MKRILFMIPISGYDSVVLDTRSVIQTWRRYGGPDWYRSDLCWQ